ncbi:MAG TPA: MMPL family transporter, partial [Kofleriaceae bacterium]|nr:MMPL family transporter [Kofleriaceae bacterium]
MTSPDVLARRYVAWLRRRALAVIIGSLVLLGGAVYLIAFKLPLFADFSYLLPQDVPAVKDLRKLEARVKATDTALVVIQAPTPEARAAAAQQMLDEVKKLPKSLVASVDGDERDAREFVKAHFDLYFPLEDLEKGEQALRHRMDQAKLHANPLYIDLEDHSDEDAKKDKQEIDDLRAKIADAQAKLDHPTNISKDGKTALLQVRIAFRETDVDHGRDLLHELERIGNGVTAAHPGVKLGFTGGAVTALSEHSAISKGILLSSLVTTLLVGLVLALYFRSATLLILLVGTIGIATAAAFGAAALTVGHLNAATAFLGAIIAGNGINYGILLIARYLEERRRKEVDAAIAQAIVGTLRPTAVASLGAS